MTYYKASFSVFAVVTVVLFVSGCGASFSNNSTSTSTPRDGHTTPTSSVVQISVSSTVVQVPATDIATVWNLSLDPAGAEVLADDDIRFLVSTKKDTHFTATPALPLPNGTYIMAWSECPSDETSRVQCTPFVGIFDAQLEKLLRKVSLPTTYKPWPVEGVRFDSDMGVGLYDVNRDGKKDFIVTYSVVEAPRAAVGSRLSSEVVIFDTDTLHLLWHDALVKSSQADVEPACFGEADYAVPACSNSSIRVTRHCAAMHYCMTDPDGACGTSPIDTRVDLFVWSSARAQYLPAKSLPMRCAL